MLGTTPFLQRAPTIARRLEREPVISVWTECDDVARFPYRPEKIAAKDFHRNAAGETRKVQLS